MHQPPSKLSRRTMFVGAGSVGAMAAAAGLLPSTQQHTVAQPALPRAPEKGGGYSLSDRVRQYYQTTRI